MNSEIAASTALFFWLLLEWKMEGKPTLVGARRRDRRFGHDHARRRLRQAVGRPRPSASSARRGHARIELTKKYNLDDALDVWAVHGMGGLLGTLCVGIFANNDVQALRLAESSSASNSSVAAATDFLGIGTAPSRCSKSSCGRPG